jgi:hypothetical protein
MNVSQAYASSPMVAAPISAIANRSEAKVKGATASGDRSNRRLLRGYVE